MNTKDPIPQKKVAFLAHKGGVGKTAICMGIADRLAKMEEDVLLIDWDHERNLTKIIPGANKATHGITDLLRDVEIDTFTVNDHIELIAGSSDANSSIYDTLAQDQALLKLESITRHILVDLNHSCEYSIMQAKYLCGVFVVVLSDDSTSFDGAIELAKDLDHWNTRYAKKPENQIRYSFVHNRYNECQDARDIDEALKISHPTTKIFKIDDRKIVERARNAKKFVSEMKSGHDKGRILEQYSDITNWILNG